MNYISPSTLKCFHKKIRKIADSLNTALDIQYQLKYYVKNGLKPKVILNTNGFQY